MRPPCRRRWGWAHSGKSGHSSHGAASDWQSDATITEHVRRLRRTVEKDPDNPRWVVTVRGVGYRFEP
jgi:DNA-binding response OmpR family regulator